MPTPEPCPDAACASKSDAMRKMFERTGKPAPKPKIPTTAIAPCPPDREELGRHSWTLLHTMAAYFPEVPSAAESAAALGFMQALGMLYPCRHCAADFQDSLEESPPRCAASAKQAATSALCTLTSCAAPPRRRTSSRVELSVWVCEAHNRVNRLLDKPEFPCTIAKLDARW